MSSVHVRRGEESDIEAIRDIFVASYQGDYPYRNFLDTHWLKRSLYSDKVLMLVAEDVATRRVLGTASIILDIGADSDLIGEFGRLAVHPDARGEGVGAALMQARLEEAQDRLHVALVEGRTAHAFSQRIAFHHGFVPVGFLPQKHSLQHAESVVLAARYFGSALRLRRNDPRVIPEVKALAAAALAACGLEDDAIVDEAAFAYPLDEELAVGGLTVEQFSPLLRIERGRTRGREVFGARTLSHGLFKLTENKAEYLIATRNGSDVVIGAIGFLRDDSEQTLKIFELVFSDERAVRGLLEAVLQRTPQWHTRYVEVDVHAGAPRMQRTLNELGFLPAAYVPAMVFVDVERVDVVRFVYLDPEDEATPPAVVEESEPFVALVSEQFTKRRVLPQLQQAVSRLAPFDGLSQEQERRLLVALAVKRYASSETLFAQGDAADGFFLILEGCLAVLRGDCEVGRVGAGELVGEYSALSEEARSVTAQAIVPVLAAHCSGAEVTKLSRGRPDIAAVLFRNVALGLGRKLRTLDNVVKELV